MQEEISSGVGVVAARTLGVREVVGSIPTPPKVLLLYGASASGHAQAASALAQRFKRLGWQAPQADLSGHFPLLASAIVSLYRTLVAHAAALWTQAHDSVRLYRLLSPLEKCLSAADFLGLSSLISRHQPRLIIATHALPLRAVAQMKERGSLTIPLYGLVTDFRAHCWWAHPAVDFYLAASAEARRDLLEWGIEEDRIAVTGIPVREEFKFRPERGVREMKKILVMGGSYGIVPLWLVRLAAREEAARGFQWIFVFGRNESALRRARKICAGAGHIRLYGFVDQVASLMRQCDVLITKPGAVSASEALACGLPIILAWSAGGQEELNARWLLDRGVAMRINDWPPWSILTRELDRMRRTVASFERWDAAGNIVQILQDRALMNGTNHV